MKRNGYLIVAILAVTFLFTASWMSRGRDAVQLALAPEISATRTERTYGVLGYKDIESVKLGTRINLNDYSVELRDREVLTIGNQTILEYTLQFDFSRLNAGDVEFSDFLSKRLGEDYLVLVDTADTMHSVQDMGGLPQKKVRFFVDNPEGDYLIYFRSKEMSDGNLAPVVWQGK